MNGTLTIARSLAGLMMLLAAASSRADDSAHASQANMSTEELSQWKVSLRSAGATSEEVAEFEKLLRELSPQVLEGWQDHIRSTSSFFAEHLMGTRWSKREQMRETMPPALFPEAQPVRSCESLRETAIKDTTINAAVIADTDQSCRVTATVVHPPANNPIRIFVALPTRGWNGRFNGTGGSGYSGGSVRSLDSRISKGYAVAATDTGNEGGGAAFAIEAPGKAAWSRLRDNAYTGIHDMTVVGKALATAFYGKAPRYAYFVGGSTGGRQALTEAQRYPEDYDGILAWCPAIARDRYVPAQLWPQVLMREANNFLSREKREAASLAAVKACDGVDGVVDGVIDDPMSCRYDPALLAGNKLREGMFTMTDAVIIRAIWEGPRGHEGRFLWWGPTPGTELTLVANTGGTPLTGKPSGEGLDWFRYFLVLDPSWDWRALSRGQFELLFEQSIQVHANIYGGDDPDLSGFRDRGGKLVIVHGLADQFVPPQASISYYENVQRQMGGDEQRITDFVRLFLAPGVDHRFIGAGPSPTGVINALIRWVEGGAAPERLLAESLDGKRTRPLLPYPNVAKYSGKGSVESAASFVSVRRLSR